MFDLVVKFINELDACTKVSLHLRTRQKGYAGQIVLGAKQSYICYILHEYHYILYYYDQAGNLAITVPPTGVKPLFTAKINQANGVVKTIGSIAESGQPETSFAISYVLSGHYLLTHYRYNSFNEVTLSDSPDNGPARPWYGAFGRAKISQDGRQATLGRASYTLNDERGRRMEVGEVPASLNVCLIMQAQQPEDLGSYLLDRTDRYHVTHTWYTSSPLAYEFAGDVALNSPNRVAVVGYRAKPLASDDDKYSAKVYDFASHYRYDIGGNVEVLVQDFAALPDPHRYKVLEYDYDLISGNVHSLYYQKGKADQFTYHYRYDKLNRLSEVLSSEIETDHSRSNLWKRDAEYVYYDHGPLRRTILGQDRLQGLDYAYTLQGWIKGVNGSLGDDYRDVAVPDISMDGYGGGGAQVPAQDAIDHRDLYRYANQYFNDDYRPIGASSTLSPMDAALPPDYELFNGNIVRHYQSTIADGFRTAGLVGEYDQLNRLRFGTNAFYGTANQAELSLTEALEAPTYDGNGNIRTLDRSYTSSTEQRHRNRLAYTYAPGTNRLTRVDADVHGAAINEDWLPFDLLRGRTEYAYDGSGNLTTETNDGQAGETRIDWNPYGKVTTVTSPTGTTTFGYGPDQHRWVKDRGERGATYYVRDAQGSTLATYEGAAGGAAGAGLTWKQQYLFGSSRLGEVVFDRPIESTTANPFNYGERRYELTNHLGNVTTVFGENAQAYTDTEDGTTYTAPALVSYRDYMAFGLGLDRGADILGTDSYRFAFNGKEIDDEGEWGQSTTAYDYGFRIYNPQVARFLSVDPLSPDYPWYTPYQFAGNKPIVAIDVDGLEELHFDVVIDNQTGTTTISYSHAQDIVSYIPDGAQVNGTSLQQKYRKAVNTTQTIVFDIYDPSYGSGRNQNSRTTGQRLDDMSNEDYSGPGASGSGYSRAYSFDAYDLAAVQQGKNELSNADKDALDQAFVGELLALVPLSRLVKLSKGAAPIAVGKGASSAYDDLLGELFGNTRTVTVYHKGRLANGQVTPGRTFSTGLDKDDVGALNRSGTVHQFDIPQDVYDEWEGKGLIQTLNDLDFETGVMNREVRFSAEISEQLNKYLKE